MFLWVLWDTLAIPQGRGPETSDLQPVRSTSDNLDMELALEVGVVL